MGLIDSSRVEAMSVVMIYKSFFDGPRSIIGRVTREDVRRCVDAEHC